MRRIYRITFLCHTRRTSQPKMPYIYLHNAPDLYGYLFLPHQTHLAAKNALNSPKKRTPGNKVYTNRPQFLQQNLIKIKGAYQPRVFKNIHDFQCKVVEIPFTK